MHESAAEKEKKDAVNSTASDELTDLQIVEEGKLLTITSSRRVPSRVRSRRVAKLREDFVKSPPTDRDEAYDTIRSIPNVGRPAPEVR